MTPGQTITVDCQCGVRLDRARIGRSANGGKLLYLGELPGVARRTQQARTAEGAVDLKAFNAAYDGPHVAEQALSDGPAITYRCRACGHGWSVQRARLQAVIERRLASGGRRVTAGVDF